MIEVYYFVFLSAIVLGMIMPQEGPHRKYYIIVMAVIHTFVCGFRYKYLTGDLRKYASTYYTTVLENGWFSEEVLHEGRNTGFYWLMKLLSEITHGEFQYLLIVIAIIIEVILAFVIYKYSSCPWLSYLVWNCMGFYVFGFSAIKQALAMAFIMWAMMAILEDNKKKFILLTLIAALIHMPSIAFLPAYWLAKNKINIVSLVGYLFAYIVIYIFRNPILDFIVEIYYEEEALEMFQDSSGGLGGRFYMMILILLCGVLLKGFREKKFEKLFNIMVVAAVLQMFSSFDNIFTRFADYYFQMSVLFIPMIFFEEKQNVEHQIHYAPEILAFNQRSMKLFVACLTIALVGFYYYSCLGATITYQPDNYLDFRFMWDVKE